LLPYFPPRISFETKKALLLPDQTIFHLVDNNYGSRAAVPHFVRSVFPVEKDSDSLLNMAADNSCIPSAYRMRWV
jgi:hypothetical protein